MMIDKFKDKNFLIIGLGYRTGVSLANFFFKNGIEYKISDSKSIDKLEKEIKMLYDHGKSIINKPQNEVDLKDFDIILVSPGVPLDIPILLKAKEMNKIIMNDIELFYQIFPNNVYIGITGSDGKTTTTTLTGKILSEKYQTIVAGNIGDPIFNHFNEIKNDTVILLELSSFQIDSLIEFKPYISAILNFSEDHLDRYGSFAKYIESKKGIYKNQTKEQYLILNYDNEITRNIDADNVSKLYFSKFEVKDCYLKNNFVYYKSEEIFDIRNTKLIGVHNQENILAAVLISKVMKVENESIAKVIESFSGLEHRTEFVAEKKGVKYYNDSKATTINAVEKAVLSFNEKINLILGGQDKGLDFTLLQNVIDKKVQNLIIMGEAKEKIDKSINFERKYLVNNLYEAVKKAEEVAEPGTIVLLSPGCTSYDEFNNYEERGKKFKELVKNL